MGGGPGQRKELGRLSHLPRTDISNGATSEDKASRIGQLIPPPLGCSQWRPLLQAWAGGKAQVLAIESPPPQASPPGDPENNLTSVGIKARSIKQGPLCYQPGGQNQVAHDRGRSKSTTEEGRQRGRAGKDRRESQNSPVSSPQVTLQDCYRGLSVASLYHLLSPRVLIRDSPYPTRQSSRVPCPPATCPMSPGHTHNLPSKWCLVLSLPGPQWTIT